MDPLLAGVAGVSLVLALVMSVVAWKLLRYERDRSHARVEALQALAFNDDLPAHEEIPPLAAREPQVGARQSAPRESSDDWDMNFREANADTPLQEELPIREPLRHSATPDDRGASARRARREPEIGRPEMTAPLFEHSASDAPASRRWLALAAVVLMITAAGATMWTFRSPEVVAVVAASRTAAPAAPDTHTRPLELLSLKHGTDPDGAFTVTGLVQNPADGQPQQGIIAIVYLFDEQGRYFATGRGVLDPSTLHPGDEAPFVIRIPNGTGVSRYRVGFRRDDGAVLAHVDRRGQLPEGTTGDAIEATPSGRPAVKSAQGL